MNIHTELGLQLRASLDMLRQCVERCPADLWIAPNPPTTVAARPDNPEWNGVERPFWRIVFHAVYFTHLYLGQDEAAFAPPPLSSAVMRRADLEAMWHEPWSLEPYELPSSAEPCDPEQLLEYLEYVDALVEPTVAGLDLASPSSGFRWYPHHTKLGHCLLNLRHLMAHTGQLSELLMLSGVDIEWK